MMTVIEQNAILIVLALLIGLAVGFWLVRGRSAAEPRARLQEDAPRRTFTPVSQELRAGGGDDSRINEGTADVAGLDAPADQSLADVGEADNLQLLKGVGPRLAATLNENGITRFEQLAALDGDALARLDEKLGSFKGRLARDRVAEQAGYLARDDRDGFAAAFGNIGGA